MERGKFNQTVGEELINYLQKNDLYLENDFQIIRSTFTRDLASVLWEVAAEEGVEATEAYVKAGIVLYMGGMRYRKALSGKARLPRSSPLDEEGHLPHTPKR